MVKFVDIIILLFLGLIYFIGTSFLITSEWFVNNIPYSIIAIFLFLLIFIVVKQKIKGIKKIAPFVQSYFETKDLKVISERPLRLSDLIKENVTVRVQPMINNVSLSRFGYIRKFVRIFTVKNKDNNTFELRVEATLNWDNTVMVDVKERT